MKGIVRGENIGKSRRNVSKERRKERELGTKVRNPLNLRVSKAH